MTVATMHTLVSGSYTAHKFSFETYQGKTICSKVDEVAIET